MSVRKGLGQDYWEAHLETIAREGIGAKAYAQREGMAVSSLYYWRRRLKAQCHGPHKPARNPPPAAPARLFVPVTMGADNGSTGRYVLTLGSGLRLELSCLPSPQWLAQVSQAFDSQVR